MKVKRGQILVITALGISLAILTVQFYLYNLCMQKIIPQNDYFTDYLLSIEQGSKHVITASLVNISNGGVSSNLARNLERWKAFIADDYQFGDLILNTSYLTNLPYIDGLWFDWSTTGIGISSASTEFHLGLSGRDLEVNWDYTINKTSKITCTGGYKALEGSNKRFKLSINIYNEGESCLAASVTLHYNKTTSWETPINLGDYSFIDYGNGTYIYSFTDNVDKILIPVQVQVVDLRGIYIRTEKTLEEN